MAHQATLKSASGHAGSVFMRNGRYSRAPWILFPKKFCLHFFWGVIQKMPCDH
jgi:hypothetical protein